MSEPNYHDKRQGFWQEHWGKGLSFDAYLATGRSQQAADWQAARERLSLTSVQREMLGSWTREMNVLFMSGIW
jgi:hypothetical protein